VDGISIIALIWKILLEIGSSGPEVVTALFTGLIGLIGVLFGGLITAGSAYLLDTRREKRETAAAQRERDFETMRAARMITAELMGARSATKTSLGSKKWWPRDFRPYEPTIFATHMIPLAPALPDEAWAIVLNAIMRVKGLQWAFELSYKSAASDALSSPTTKEDMELLSAAQKRFDEAITALRPFIRRIPDQTRTS